MALRAFLMRRALAFFSLAAFSFFSLAAFSSAVSPPPDELPLHALMFFLKQD